MHRILIAGMAVVLLAGTHLPARAASPSLVLWAGQPLDAAPTPAPRGALLNLPPGSNYWGAAINSGVQITNDAVAKIQSLTFGAPCALDEITLLVQGTGAIAVESAAGATGAETWQTAPLRAPIQVLATTQTNETWVRLLLKPATAKQWRLNLPDGLVVRNTLLWGQAPAQPVEPVWPVRKKFPVAFESLPGADAATMSDHIYWSWQRPLLEDKRMNADGAVWAQHDKWTRISAAPILPPRETLNQPVRLVMARNEHEGALLTLTSLRDQVGKPIHDSGIYQEFVPGFQEFELKLGPVRGPTPKKIKLTLRVAATLRSQLWGTVTGPLFSADDRIGLLQMLRHFTNGPMIADFPRVALPPCGSHVFWLEVETDSAAPGQYTTTLTAAPGPSVPVEVEVLPVTLPSPRVWVHSWSQGPVGTTWPFIAADTLANTVGDKISRGISSFSGVPTPHTEAAEARRQKQDVYFFYNYIIPNGGSGKPWVSYGYGNLTNIFYNLTEKDHEVISNHVTDVVRQYREAGVEYADWVGELWDEPGDASSELVFLSTAWVHAVDPKVQVYVNPAFPNKVESFRKMSQGSSCFVPFWGNWFKGTEWRAEIKPGRVNAFYAVQGSNRSELNEELVGHYRVMPWHAFKLGLNGWGFYAYYGPRGDPYTDYDPPGSETDYQVVYPGPRGPVPSRQAEAMRDGWEDYRLLTLLAASGKPEAKEAIAAACAQIPMGREPLTAQVDFEAIRLRLLEAAAKIAPDRARK
ncbi:DUF4091 domain-containing protein [bacterium]|nr:DUF4091 domain-containing protein [bacterium]